MPEPILNGPRIVSRIGKSIAAGMSEHVDVNIVVEAAKLTDALHKPIDSVRGEGSAALGGEYDLPA